MTVKQQVLDLMVRADGTGLALVQDAEREHADASRLAAEVAERAAHLAPTDVAWVPDFVRTQHVTEQTQASQYEATCAHRLADARNEASGRTYDARLAAYRRGVALIRDAHTAADVALPGLEDLRAKALQRIVAGLTQLRTVEARHAELVDEVAGADKVLMEWAGQHGLAVAAGDVEPLPRQHRFWPAPPVGVRTVNDVIATLTRRSR